LRLRLFTRLKEVVRISRPSVDLRPFKRVLIVAGEASADLHGSNLVKAMKRVDPELAFSGIGGERMARAGVKILFSASDMAVVGMTEALYGLRTIFRASREIKSLIRENRPDLLILIDYPGFNIHLAKTAKRFQVPVLYYISPQVWAWRTGRVKKIARRIDRMAVILPFEEAFYRGKDISVDYVGHPLMDALPSISPGAGTPFDPGHPVLGLLPGSRKAEIKHLLPDMIKAAEILQRHCPKLECVLHLAPTLDPEFIHSFTDTTTVKIRVTRGEIHEGLKNCHVALVTSGTVTLELAIMGIPMVIVYRMSFASYWAARMVVHVPYVGLVNLVAEAYVVPELIQDAVTPERLAQEILKILKEPEVRREMKRELAKVKGRLGERGASERTAQIALEMMKGV
jgi:lipid-A-disaccharide synthase